jgi:cell division inhibitor SepF
MASGIMRKAMVFLGLDDEEFDDYDAYEEAPVAPQPPRRYQPEPVEPVPSQQHSGVRALPRDGNGDTSGSLVTVTPRPSPTVRPLAPVQNVKVHVVAPDRFGDAQEIGDRFRHQTPVVVNLQDCADSDPKLARRILDFCSGVTYALDGAMSKIGDQVFLLTPANVEVSAEERRRLQERGLWRP